MYVAIFLILFLAIVFGVTVYLRRRESSYIKKSVTETMSDEMWDAIAKEREEALERGRRFRKTLKEELEKVDGQKD